MAGAKHGSTVLVHYTGTLNDGRVFDGTAERDAHQLTIGDGATLIKFEQAIIGMEPGDKKTVEIASKNAFGRHMKNMERVLRPDQCPTGKVKSGQHLRIDTGDGEPSVVKVIGVHGEQIVVDLNHPLAGEDLTFEIELVDIL